MKKLLFLIFLSLILSSCGTNREIISSNNPYYNDLHSECRSFPDFEAGNCDQSVDIMEENNYIKAENREGTFTCPSGMMVDRARIPGAMAFCHP